MDKNILLIITGGIAAYKCPALIRLLRKSGAHVKCIMTESAKQFTTPMTIASLTENPVYDTLWSLKDETEMGHIRLSREADLIIVAPATANIMAQMAHGMAQDLASTVLLAADTPIMIAPAMNHKMWDNPATQGNIQTLKSCGIHIIDPTEGDMACGEYGVGRMAEPEDIVQKISRFFLSQNQAYSKNTKTKDTRPLAGKTALVTAGPTFEPIDPVRYIGNHSSGKQGYAIAEALSYAGADVTLITGPTHLEISKEIKRIDVMTAKNMLEHSINLLPCDIAVCTAAVSDFHVKNQSDNKIKKRGDKPPPKIELAENPDILHTISTHKKRPALVIGFAAETENLIENATIKLTKKSCDMIVANDVSPSNSVFGSDHNHVHFITKENIKDLGRMTKTDVAGALLNQILTIIKNTGKNNESTTPIAAE